jgi:hypothetical protein
MAVRVSSLSPSEWDDVRQLLEATVGPVSTLEGGSAREVERRPLNILTVIAHQPQLLAPFLGWASALALQGVVPRRDHEVLALRTAVNCRSDCESDTMWSTGAPSGSTTKPWLESWPDPKPPAGMNTTDGCCAPPMSSTETPRSATRPGRTSRATAEPTRRDVTGQDLTSSTRSTDHPAASVPCNVSRPVPPGWVNVQTGTPGSDPSQL